MTIELSDFEKIELRIGTIVRVEDFPEAKRPAYKLWVDLGEFGIKKSSAQITVLYQKDNLIGKQVLCVCNFKPRQIGTFMSEILVTGIYDENQAVHLVSVDGKVPDGSRLC
jgi:tRNA-binding protein